MVVGHGGPVAVLWVFVGHWRAVVVLGLGAEVGPCVEVGGGWVVGGWGGGLGGVLVRGRGGRGGEGLVCWTLWRVGGGARWGEWVMVAGEGRMGEDFGGEGGWAGCLGIGKMCLITCK